MIRTFMRAALAATLAVALLALVAPPASAADQIVGAGSTWSQIAVDQWRADVRSQGLSVNYQGNGSTTGRSFYIQKQVDFAVSEIPFQPASRGRDGQPLYDEIAQAAARPYAYMPVVAGGTAFMYHLDVSGKRIDNLRLSGQTIAKIFTGQISNWNDPAIKADDGRTFPDLPIMPVIRSDGSGTSAQFTAYLANMYPDIWNPFCSEKFNLPAPCPPTSLYPFFGNYKAQTGSDGVANFVAAPYNNGAITYVEYGYAKQRDYPVVEVLNQAGYFTKPTAENVAIALTRARINPDRTQVLNDVYRNPDPRTYPVSSYSYMIVPTTTDAPMTASKGETLGRFILYFLCTGQQKAAQLGYSPLPPNLVAFGFEAVTRIPGAPAPPALKDCANPTIQGSFKLENAPLPAASQKKGAPRAASDGGANESAGGSGAVSAADLAATTDTTIAGEELETGSAEGELTASRTAITTVSKTEDDIPVGFYIAIVLLILAVVFGPPALAVALRRRGPSPPSPPPPPSRPSLPSG